jgi:DNA-binding protein YbaB
MDYELQARVDELAAGHRERLEHVQQVQQQARHVTAVARSRDGLIILEVGAQGQLLGLQLDPAAYDRLSPQRLAGVIVELARVAAADAAAQVREIVAPVLPAVSAPAEPPTLDVLRDWAARGRP